MSKGLFRYCRHPNYFGEMLLWTSLTALAGGSGVLAAYPWVAVSPAFTIFLLTQASGEHTSMSRFTEDLATSTVDASTKNNSCESVVAVSPGLHHLLAHSLASGLSQPLHPLLRRLAVAGHHMSQF